MANKGPLSVPYLTVGFCSFLFALSAYGTDELFDSNARPSLLNRSPTLGQRVVTLSASTAQLAQSQSARLTFSASRANRNRSTVVKYRVAGTAVLGTDYHLSGTAGRMVIPAGAVSASLDLTALTADSSAKSVTVILSQGTGYRLSSPSQATVMIANPSATPATPTPTPTPAPIPTATPSPSAAPVPTLTPTPKPKVCIALRSDGLPGTGTIADPFNGSTAAKFDSVMQNIPPNTLIHLGAGTFSTRGSLSWRTKDGWEIEGTGMYSTTLLQIAIQALQFQVIGGWSNDLQVHDLTVDCNYLNLSPSLNVPVKAIGAVSAVSGYYNNVRVIHSGGTKETFALGFAQYGVGSIPPQLVVIENCRIEQSGPHVTAIFASNSQTNDNSDTFPGAGDAIFRNCYVEGTGIRATAGIAFQVNGFSSALVDSCTTIGCNYSVYRDTLPQTDFTVTNCNINSVIDAIGFVGAPTDNLIIRGNTLAGGEIIVRTDGATNVVIENNDLVPGPNYNNFWQPFQTSDSTYILSNRLNPAITNGSGALAKGKVFGNRYDDGSNILFLLDNYVP